MKQNMIIGLIFFFIVPITGFSADWPAMTSGTANNLNDVKSRAESDGGTVLSLGAETSSSSNPSSKMTSSAYSNTITTITTDECPADAPVDCIEQGQAGGCCPSEYPYCGADYCSNSQSCVSTYCRNGYVGIVLFPCPSCQPPFYLFPYICYSVNDWLFIDSTRLIVPAIPFLSGPLYLDVFGIGVGFANNNIQIAAYFYGLQTFVFQSGIRILSTKVPMDSTLEVFLENAEPIYQQLLEEYGATEDQAFIGLMPNYAEGLKVYSMEELRQAVSNLHDDIEIVPMHQRGTEHFYKSP
jgi:hypothetical protein